MKPRIDNNQMLSEDVKNDGELFDKLCHLIGLNKEEEYRVLRPRLEVLLNINEQTANQIIESGFDSSTTISPEEWDERRPGYDNTLKILLKAMGRSEAEYIKDRYPAKPQ